MGWSSDLESGGRRFDSRLAQGRFGVTFSSILGCLGMCLGVVWVVEGLGFRVEFLKNIRNGFLEKITKGVDLEHPGLGCLGACGQRKIEKINSREIKGW